MDSFIVGDTMTHGQPLVSIIIPAYNSEPTIRKTLESAIGQSWPNKEVIVVDDGSTDRTVEIAESFSIDNPVRVFRQGNEGACKARNVGFLNSKGDYVQYLDADDLLSTDKVKNQLDLCPINEDDVVLSSRLVRFFDDNALPSPSPQLAFLERDWLDPVEWLVNEWEGKGMGQTSVWLTPRKLIERAGPWNERLLINQDGEFFTRVLLHARHIRFSKDSIVYYRSGIASSVSQSRGRAKVDSLLLSLRLYRENILEVEDSLRVRHALASKFLTYIYLYCDSHPDLAEQARKELLALDLKVLPRAGGENFRVLAKLVGFFNALKLRSFFRSKQREAQISSKRSHDRK